MVELGLGPARELHPDADFAHGKLRGAATPERGHGASGSEQDWMSAMDTKHFRFLLGTLAQISLFACTPHTSRTSLQLFQTCGVCSQS